MALPLYDFLHYHTVLCSRLHTKAQIALPTKLQVYVQNKLPENNASTRTPTVLFFLSPYRPPNYATDLNVFRLPQFNTIQSTSK